MFLCGSVCLALVCLADRIKQFQFFPRAGSVSWLTLKYTGFTALHRRPHYPALLIDAAVRGKAMRSAPRLHIQTCAERRVGFGPAANIPSPLRRRCSP